MDYNKGKRRKLREGIAIKEKKHLKEQWGIQPVEMKSSGQLPGALAHRFSYALLMFPSLLSGHVGTEAWISTLSF